MEENYKDPTMYLVKSILILDNDGSRIFAKYFDSTFPTVKEQKTFEKNLFNKTSKSNSEIIMLEGLTCVYRSNVDIFIYVIGSLNENELILLSVLNCLFECISLLLKRNVEKRYLLDHLNSIFLAIDEICDCGIILECDPAVVFERAAFKMDDISLQDQTIASVLQSAKDQIRWPIMK